MKALVTGGAGFIGSHLVKHLVAENIKTKVYDNLYSGHLENLTSVQNKIEFIYGDICDKKHLLSAMQDVDCVFHQAALVSVPQSTLNLQLTQQINILGTLNVLETALKADVRRIVIASSCAIYGDCYQPPLKEDLASMPKSPYAVSKVATEAWGETFYHTYGLETISLRYFNVYGVGQRADSEYAAVIPKFINCYRNKQRPKIYGDGQQSRDFISVSDVVQANIAAATISSKILNKHRIFNVCTGIATNLLELLQLISEKFGYCLEPEFLDIRRGDIQASWGDITRASVNLNFSVKETLSEKVSSVIDRIN
ncbi:NAD-dependent epimerase/dehydratase [Planktothrix rubescens CCAP 1459/22]|jgi:Nucleoside-diphosphate-sugar epimerases|uniref:NAD-dependent epimerase/dehydratase n=2 Tax=Planktothrix TaxID=54304 RepID=A0A6J7ZEG4_PLARU|nr:MULTISPECIES: NAD-dependent epimerase/dehydratase family protein [Planktothrix]CAC5339782.1 NAD-dependent epimerase/dehydratase [Planktothrix rubescens NIVA-CYA 18]CAD5986449.1 Putative UDP-glucose 4-epimerase [Planktothrix rubescens NIVA-CYA 18]CAH2575643.1 Putative UDP-glucose 4-epimerase [Planktothrix rubescens]